MTVTLQSGIVQAATGTVLGLVGARLAGQAYAIGAGIGATVELGVILAGKILPREYQYTFQSVCSFTASAVGAHIYGRLANTQIKTTHILLFAGGYTLVTTTIRYFSAPRQQSASSDLPKIPTAPPQSRPSSPPGEAERAKEPIPPSIRYLKSTASNIGLTGFFLEPPEEVRFGELLASLFVKGSLTESEFTEVNAFLSKGLPTPQDVPEDADVTKAKIFAYLEDLAGKWDDQKGDPELWNFANAAYMITTVFAADSLLEVLATLYVIQQAIAGNLDESLFDLISKKFRNAKFFDDGLNNEFLSVFKRCMQNEAVDAPEQALYIGYMNLAAGIFGFLKQMRPILKDHRAEAVEKMGRPRDQSAAMLDLIPFCEYDLSAWEVSILMNRQIGERLLSTLPRVLEEIAGKKLAAAYPSKIEDMDKHLTEQEIQILRSLLRRAVRSFNPSQEVVDQIGALVKKRTKNGEGDGQGLLYNMVCKIILDGLTGEDPSRAEYREVLQRLAVQLWVDEPKMNSKFIYLIFAYADLYPRLSEDKELQQDHRIILHAAGRLGQSIQPEPQVTLSSGDLKDSVDGLDDFKLTAAEKTELSGLLARLYFENNLQADERNKALTLAARGLHKGSGMVGKAMNWLGVGSNQVPQQTMQEAEQLVENYVIQFLDSAEAKFNCGMMSTVFQGRIPLALQFLPGIVKSTPEEMITAIVISLSLLISDGKSQPLDQLAHLYIWRKALEGGLEEACLNDLLKRSDIQIFSSAINQDLMNCIMRISRKETIAISREFLEDLLIGVTVVKMRYFWSEGMQQQVEQELRMLTIPVPHNISECIALIADRVKPIAKVVAKFKELVSVPVQDSQDWDLDSLQKNMQELMNQMGAANSNRQSPYQEEIDWLPVADELD